MAQRSLPPTDREDEDELRDESLSLWRIAFSPIIWAAHFLLCYAGAAIWCARVGPTQGTAFLRLSVLALTLIALGLIGWVGWRALQQWRPEASTADRLHHPENRHHFLGHAAVLLSLISVVGVIYVALPALFIGTCQ
ncbi:hypothetical protein H4P12_12530 [Paracoccus sp. 11-3]|uniref:Uncharacterized protein n=1 Tax=Paracoccus amoyensis TaxID=2760093 RepID=A0A926GHS3_9RHOB|nr:hypothetical protein [Paracoccus amoyensis]MBC9247514.1 hypothetical protein [Paracoccus amoyensis]